MSKNVHRLFILECPGCLKEHPLIGIEVAVYCACGGVSYQIKYEDETESISYRFAAKGHPVHQSAHDKAHNLDDHSMNSELG